MRGASNNVDRKRKIYCVYPNLAYDNKSEYDNNAYFTI